MPGPVPKNALIRQRRNRAAGRALLPAESHPLTAKPKLPKNPLGKWHVLTKAWWRDVWSSPQHHEFLRADLGSLLRLAMLVDMFWKSGELPIAKEIRVLEREFGLTPLSRRRLEWTVAQTEDAVDRRELNRVTKATIIDSDPRGILGSE